MINLVFGVTAILLFIAGVIVGLINYHQSNRKTFNFLNHFPFEMINNPKMKLSLPLRFIMVIFAAVDAVFAITTFMIGSQLMISTLLAIVLVLNSFFIFTLFVSDMRFYKVHLAIDSIFFILNIIAYALLGYYIIRHPSPLFDNALMYISFGIAIILLLMLGVSSLGKWAYLKKETLEDGSTTFSRGKVIVLALYEWIFLLMHLVFIGLVIIFSL